MVHALPSVTHSQAQHAQVSLLSLGLQSARLLLAFERARAPHAAIAARRFLQSQCRAIGRVFRLGAGATQRLLKLEIACAAAGLGYQIPGQTPMYPWQLPDAFINLPSASLPSHPLIDPGLLSDLASVGQTNGTPCAIDALSRLLQPDSFSGRWHGIPRIDHDGPIPQGAARVAVCLHLFYPALWPRLHQALQAIPQPWDLYVTVPEFACTPALERVARDHPSVRFLPGANRGRDVLPFLRLLETGVFDRYDAVCKLHSKRSPHMHGGDAWLDQVLLALLGSPDSVNTLLARFRNDPKLGLIGPSALAIHPGNPLHRAKNSAAVDAVSTRSGITTAAASAPFFAGTMFWFRPAAMTSVRNLGLTTNDFPLEMAQTDGTLAHAIERLAVPLVEKSGFTSGGV